MLTSKWWLLIGVLYTHRHVHTQYPYLSKSNVSFLIFVWKSSEVEADTGMKNSLWLQHISYHLILIGQALSLIQIHLK